MSRFDFPLFGKPEWGQNANGISYIENEKELLAFIKQSKKSTISYLIQTACDYKNEYEVCFARDPDNPKSFKIHSIVQSLNDDGNKISSINAQTRYKEI